MLEGEDEARAPVMSGHRVVRRGSVDQASAALVLPEPARVRPRRKIGGKGQPCADDVIVLDVGDRQVAQRLGGIEERGEVNVESGQVTLDRGDGDLPGRGLVGAPHQGSRPHTFVMIEHQRLGDPSSERMTGNPYGIGPAQVVEDGQRCQSLICSTL